MQGTAAGEGGGGGQCSGPGVDGCSGLAELGQAASKHIQQLHALVCHPAKDLRI